MFHGYVSLPEGILNMGFLNDMNGIEWEHAITGIFNDILDSRYSIVGYVMGYTNQLDWET